VNVKNSGIGPTLSVWPSAVLNTSTVEMTNTSKNSGYSRANRATKNARVPPGSDTEEL